MREEIGNIIWDALALGVLAEKEGYATLKEILEQSNHKTVFRNPHVFGIQRTSNKKKVREIRSKAKADYKQWLNKKRNSKTG